MSDSSSSSSLLSSVSSPSTCGAIMKHRNQSTSQSINQTHIHPLPVPFTCFIPVLVLFHFRPSTFTCPFPVSFLSHSRCIPVLFRYHSCCLPVLYWFSVCHIPVLLPFHPRFLPVPFPYPSRPTLILCPTPVSFPSSPSLTHSRTLPVLFASHSRPFLCSRVINASPWLAAAREGGRGAGEEEGEVRGRGVREERGKRKGSCPNSLDAVKFP